MSRYAALLLPSSNRVYSDAATDLVRAELEILGTALGGRLGDIRGERIAGVPYVTFDCDGLTEDDAALLGTVSALYALYEVTGEALRPVVAPSMERLDDDLVSILKYPGKTNEQFTRLLLNVTALSSGFASDFLTRRFTVLDPLCGRGTTLNQALLYGWDACGIDVDARDVEAYATFIQRWLKDKRLKHRADYGLVRRDRRVVGRRLEVSFAATKEEYREGRVQRLDVVAADTVGLLDFFRPSSMDLIVTDAPYGVQHGSRAGGGLARSPLDLLRAAAPVWAEALRREGALGLAWNTRVTSRADAVEALSRAGFEVLDDGPYRAFEHRVDQSIQRDVIVARKA